MTEFLLPSLGADMDEGTVVEWRVAPGDAVRRGDVVVLVETEKGVIEVEVWEDAVVAELLAAPGTTVAVGTPIARLDTAPAAEPAPAAPPGDGPPPAVTPSIPAAPATAPEPASPPIRHLAHELGVALEAVAGTGGGGAVTRDDIRAAAGALRSRVGASPRARAVAAELGVDLAAVVGTGLDGAVTEADVRAGHPAAGPAPTAPLPPAVEEPRSQDAMRRAIARVMSRSKREIPHYYLGTTIDLERALVWLDDVNAARPIARRVLPAVLLLKAAARAVREVPEMNGFFLDGEYRPSDDVHLGVAISLRTGGLIAPAIHHADRLSVDELMAALRDLVQRTRAGGLRGSEMADPTITVTNLGDRGVETAFPVIYAPQVAMVGFGTIAPRPRAIDGMLAVRRVVAATLAADHRVSDGHRGGLYLAAVDHLLQEPEDL